MVQILDTAFGKNDIRGIYQKDINDFKIAPQDLIIIEKE